MTKKSNKVGKSKKSKTGKPTTKQNTLSKQELDKQSKDIAELYVSSPHSAARIVNALIKHQKGSDSNFLDVFERLIKSNIQVRDNDLWHLEEVLLNQISVLNSVFYHYIEKATAAEYLGHLQAFSEIAFKAQKQCRVTVSALTELKNPRRATFIRQQNNAINQQVNNNLPPPEVKESQKNKIFLKNELLELTHEQLDTREALTTIPTNTEMETVGAIDRSSHPRRKGH